VRYAGRTGITMLKLAKNSRVLQHNNQNCVV
jgi:hypothetical protein